MVDLKPKSPTAWKEQVKSHTITWQTTQMKVLTYSWLMQLHNLPLRILQMPSKCSSCWCFPNMKSMSVVSYLFPFPALISEMHTRYSVKQLQEQTSTVNADLKVNNNTHHDVNNTEEVNGFTVISKDSGNTCSGTQNQLMLLWKYVLFSFFSLHTTSTAPV